MNGIVAVAIEIFQRASGKRPVPDFLFWIGAALCIFVAFFGAWDEQFNRAQTLQTKFDQQFPDALQSQSVKGSSGQAVSSMPFHAPTYKKFVVWFDGYENISKTPQTISFPLTFTESPMFIANIDPPCTVSTSQLTLPASMDAPVTGWAVLEGY
jgi:hypothetical protein